ncbi:FkbM family methyltransferase [Leptothermofonsia sp. ETS-13]|uniref:FkbM family methyltransferase n=1 Tax=Leptothermofonsia sp. ETS-13 TaxID=3035696 RepID=UPI003BA20C70
MFIPSQNQKAEEINDRIMQLEELLNLPDILQQIWDYPPNRVMELAEEVIYTRPLKPYPGWYFNIEWDSPEPVIRLRRAIWEYFRKKQLEERIIIPWYQDLRIFLYLGNDFSSQQFIAGCYEPNEFYYLNQILRPGMTFLDIGANDGIYALFASRCVGERGLVLAFEPSQREFKNLQENINLNQLSNIQTFQLALSNTEGITTLKIADFEHSGQNTFGEFVHDVVACEQIESVPVKRLDNVIETANIQAIDVIKIDIEGAEFSVLQGAQNLLKQHHPLLLLEVFDEALQRQGSSAETLMSFLRSQGYKLFTFGRFVGVPVQFESDYPLSKSFNIIAAHPNRKWVGLSEAEQQPILHQELEGTRQLLARVEGDLERSQTKLHDVDLEFQRLKYKHDLMEYELSEKLRHLKQGNVELKEQLQQTQTALEQAQTTITALTSSKFWQLRNCWLGLKRALSRK